MVVCCYFLELLEMAERELLLLLQVYANAFGANVYFVVIQ